MTKSLVADPNYVCCRCNGKAQPIVERTVTKVDVDGSMLDVEATFCYCALVGALTVPLLPDAVWPVDFSGNPYLS